MNIDKFNREISNFLIDCEVSIKEERKLCTILESKKDMIKLQNIIYNNTVHIEDIKDIYEEVTGNKQFLDVEILDYDIIQDCAAPMGLNIWYVDTNIRGKGDSVTISYIENGQIWWHVIMITTYNIPGNNPLDMDNFVSDADAEQWWFSDLIDYNVISDYKNSRGYFGFFEEGLKAPFKQSGLLNWGDINPMKVKE